MASLTYTAHVARNTIKYGGLGFIGFTIIWILGASAIAAWNEAHPPYVKPNIRYGILNQIKFIDKQFTKKSFTAQLPNDSFPVFKDQAKVYFIASSDNTFLALEEDKKIAHSFGFNGDPQRVTEGVYQFQNSTTNQTLTTNVADGSFKLKYPYENDQMLLDPSNNKVPDKNGAIQIAKEFLSRSDKYTKDLQDGEIKVTYWKINFDGLAAVSSQSEANAARVDFFRSALGDKFKIVSSDYNGAPVSALVTGSSVEGKKVIELNYHYTNIDREAFGTYPIKTAEAAFADLKNGNYWPAVDSAGNSTIIRRVSLAYFEPITLTNYLQPVFVFEGDNNFVGYVPAITNAYVK